MSADWAKYCTPETTRGRGRVPAENGVVSLVVGPTRAVAKQQVTHSPILENRAHSDVAGEKTTETRMRLARIAEWVIKARDPSAT
jgi:hypothetical protein